MLLNIRYITRLLFLMTITPFICYGQSPVDFVNPFIGTGGHGHTFPGATVPFGMVQLSPDTRLDGWDGCSGYHYSDEYIYGFSHTHLSGTGVPDYCDILFMPFSGEVLLNNGADGKPGYRSKFSHQYETAGAGYYSVELEKDGIKAELTATARVGMHAYTFQKNKTQCILIDLFHRDKVTDSWLEITDTNEIAGYRGSSSWARDQRLYFVAQFSKPFSSTGIAADDEKIPFSGKVASKNLKAWLEFEKSGSETIVIKVGLSATSIENARLNLMTEAPGWDFNETRHRARSLWENELNKISVKEGSKDEKTVFYTALYHTMISPNIYNDVDGTFLGRDLQPHKNTQNNYYTVFSLWDTYRALHPLYTIIDHKRTNDFINTFISQYELGRLLPVWELSSNETFCMIGYHAVPVIADAYIKGIRGFDQNKAFKAMVNSAMQDHMGLKYYRQMGYIPAENEHESVSKTLEYAYDDWCISVMADSLGLDSIRDVFAIRAQSYKNMFDPASGFMRARYNGGWYAPFDPAEVNFNYTEANSWQYSFYVPHDMNHFIALHGGKQATSVMLDSLFNVSSKTTGRDQSDITGLIGQYAHGNEPSHHIAYLYDYCDMPWKTQEKVSFIMRNFYTNTPDGLIGNEDCGQMSAWAVYSSLGFYPVCPGSTQYAIGTPLFSEASINLENGKKFVVKALRLNSENIYVKNIKLNGLDLTRSFIQHDEIMAGGELTFEMSSSPSLLPFNAPETSVKGKEILPAPYAEPNNKIFYNNQRITLKGYDGATITYTTDGSEPEKNSEKYKEPILITSNTTLKFNAFKDGYIQGSTQQADFTQSPADIEVISISPYASQYSGSGRNNLIDGLKGSNDYRLGGWQGFQGVDMEIVLKINNNKPINSISSGFLQDINSWIFMPSQIDLFTSADGVTFHKINSIKNDFPVDKWGTFTHEYIFNNLNIKERFIKIIAKNAGLIPEWHPASGNITWIFADEISINF